MTNPKKLRARTLARHFQNRERSKKKGNAVSAIIIGLAVAYCALSRDVETFAGGQTHLYELVDESAHKVLAGRWIPSRFR